MNRVPFHFLIGISLLGVGLMAGCSKERPPRSVSEFLDKPVLLEAAMIRCAEDRSGMRYEAECINAREAVSRIEAKEEAARKAELEALSESKRRALRRTQEAAAAARRRAAEAERERRETEYLAQFGVAPPDDASYTDDQSDDNRPLAIIPEASQDSGPTVDATVPTPANDTDAESVLDAAPDEQEDPQTDLAAVREELRKRTEEGED